MGLAQYQRKRRFDKTAEPKGKKRPSSTGHLYIIQKHAASRLHYDFRLELDGVLKSWAVPKGPSLDPTVKSLAVQVEDHPVEYGSFEGTIPQGEYGGGTVMLWDRGTWEATGDAAADYRKGKLHFILHGEKLQGEWVLVRMHTPGDDERKNWLLRKVDDKFAKPAKKYNVLTAEDRSVVSGRDLDEIASNPKRKTWSSNRASKTAPRVVKKKVVRTTKVSATASRARTTAPRTRKKATRRKPKLDPSGLSGATRSGTAKFIPPELASLVRSVPNGDNWLHEIKFDGYRLVCVIRAGKVQLFTRNAKDWTDRFADVAAAAATLPVEQAVLDGEVAAVDEAGRTDFQTLQNAMRAAHAPNLAYYLFDILHLDGYDLRAAPLLERKQLLADLLVDPPAPLQFSTHILGSGTDVFQEACRLTLEGVISKRVDAPYTSGRARDWVKTKCGRSQEFVIGGFTDPGGTRVGFGAMLLGYYDKAGKFTYAGRVGTGFDDAALKRLHARMTKLEIDAPAFSNPPRGADARGVHWLKPELVADIVYGEMTRDGILRHPVFHGLREDKPARQVTLEEAPSVKATASTGRRAVSRNGKAAKGRAAPAQSKKTQEEDVVIAGVKLSNPNKVLYPEQGLTKRDLAEYYEAIAGHMIPHVRNRPLMIVRCPQGRGQKCFYQKHMNDGVPEPWRGVRIKEQTETGVYVVLDDAEGLVALAQLGVLEIHTWGCRADKIEQPDQIIFDLDPSPEVGWIQVVEAARAVRDRLAEIGLVSFVKTTGGKGLHVVAPLVPRAEWPEVKAFTKSIADAMTADDPKRYIATMSKAKRTGKIFVDYLRNGRGATAVAAYSTRARLNAPVSMPIRWEDLSRLKGADVYRVPEAVAHMNKSGDPWDGFFKVKQSLTKRLLASAGVD